MGALRAGLANNRNAPRSSEGRHLSERDSSPRSHSLTKPCMTIRRYRPSDTPALLALFHDTVHAVNARDYSPEQLNAWAPPTQDADAWTARLTARDTLVAEDGPLLVGFCDLEGDGHLDHLYCHANYQRRGVGTRLLEGIEQIAREKGITHLTTEASITARPFFEARGFQTLQAQTVHVRGLAFANYRMEKEIMEKELL